jgi:hypothetical protein
MFHKLLPNHLLQLSDRTDSVLCYEHCTVSSLSGASQPHIRTVDELGSSPGRLHQVRVTVTVDVTNARTTVPTTCLKHYTPVPPPPDEPAPSQPSQTADEAPGATTSTIRFLPNRVSDSIETLCQQLRELGITEDDDAVLEHIRLRLDCALLLSWNNR